MMLKRFCLVLAGFVALFSASTSWAQMKIGYIDPQQILQNYKPFQEADREYKRYEEELGREYAKLENELKTMRERYDRQALLLSEQRKQEEQQAIRKKQEDLQRFLMEIQDPASGKLTRKNQALSEPIIREVNEIIQQVAKDSGYDFLLNTAALAYANEAHDLTQKVMEALEKQLEEKVKKAAKTQ